MGDYYLSRPVRCYTCGKTIAQYGDEYDRLVGQGVPNLEAFQRLADSEFEIKYQQFNQLLKDGKTPAQAFQSLGFLVQEGSYEYLIGQGKNPMLTFKQLAGFTSFSECCMNKIMSPTKVFFAPEKKPIRLSETAAQKLQAMGVNISRFGSSSDVGFDPSKFSPRLIGRSGPIEVSETVRRTSGLKLTNDTSINQISTMLDQQTLSGFN